MSRPPPGKRLQTRVLDWATAPWRLGIQFRPDPDYRPNPERAIFVSGSIDEVLLGRLTPAIIALTSRNRDPITVYIDSPGGSVYYAGCLKSLLRSPGLDTLSPCRLITVGANLAGSAAADLLVAGDYALVYPHCVLHFHGGRNLSTDPLTAEDAAHWAETLKRDNRSEGVELAHRSVERFLLRFLVAHNAPTKAPALQEDEEFPRFTGFLRLQLSPAGLHVLDAALERLERSRALSAFVGQALSIPPGDNPAEALPHLRAELLKAVIDFESLSDASTAFPAGSALPGRIADDFELFCEYRTSSSSELLDHLSARWGPFLSPARPSEPASAEESAAARLRLQHVLSTVWLLHLAICQALQQGENTLTPTDAYWLGLIDEVVGNFDLPSFRHFTEGAPDPISVA